MAYVIPSIRKKQPVTSIVESEFPSLGNNTKSSKTQAITGFKQVILDRIERELIDDTPVSRTNPQTMSLSELYATGWAVLSLTDPTLYQRFSTSVQTGNWATPVLVSMSPIVPMIPNTTQTEQYESEDEPEYESESEAESEAESD